MMVQAARKTDMRYGRMARHEEPASRFIPYTHHMDETTLKTRDCYFLKIIKVEGLPFETADQLDLNHRKATRATLLRGLSSSRFAIYHHIIRREVKNSPDRHFENEWCRALDQAYQQRLSQNRLFVNEQYITIVRRPAQGAIGLMEKISRSAFSNLDRKSRQEQDLESLKALNEATDNLVTSLSAYQPRILGFKETERGVFSEPLSFLSYLVNLGKSDIRPPSMAIADYLPSKRLSFGAESFEMRGSAPDDIKLGAILSLKEYAQGTGPGMLDGLLRLPHEFILTQSFGCVDRQSALNAMRETQRKLVASEQGALSLEEDLYQAIDDTASGHATFGEHHLTVTAIGKSPAALNRSLSEIIGTFVNLGIVATREDVNLEPAFWAQLPGNFSYIARRALISNKNFACFASLHAFPSGRASGNHWGQAITRLETTSGTPYWFNFHERDVGNFTVIGPTGTGKTVLLTFLNAQAQHL